MFKYISLGLGTALLAVSFLYFQKVNQVKNMELKSAQLIAKQEAEMRKIEQANYQEVINAINEATQRSIEIEMDNTAALDANKRLQQTISKLNTQVSNLSKNARADYSTALSELLEVCSARYIDVARKADGHVNDIRTQRKLFDSIKSVE